MDHTETKVKIIQKEFSLKTRKMDIIENVKTFLKFKHILDLTEDDHKQHIYDAELVKKFFQIVFEYDPENDQEDILLKKFPLFGITSAFKKFQTHEPLLKHEERAIINFADKFTTCTLDKDKVAKLTEDSLLKNQASDVIDIVKEVNKHSHTRA